MASEPLAVAEEGRGPHGRIVKLRCTQESEPCGHARVAGTFAFVDEAVAALEAVHQSAHALRGDET